MGTLDKEIYEEESSWCNERGNASGTKSPSHLPSFFPPNEIQVPCSADDLFCLLPPQSWLIMFPSVRRLLWITETMQMASFQVVSFCVRVGRCGHTAASKESFDIQTMLHANSANRKKSLKCQSLPLTSHKMNYRLTQLLWALWLDYISHESLKSNVPVTVSNTSSVIFLMPLSMSYFLYSTSIKRVYTILYLDIIRAAFSCTDEQVVFIVWPRWVSALPQIKTWRESVLTFEYCYILKWPMLCCFMHHEYTRQAEMQ